MKRLLSMTSVRRRWIGRLTILLATAPACFSSVGCDDTVEYSSIADTSSAGAELTSGRSGGGIGSFALSKMPEGESQTPTEIKEAGEGANTAVVAGRIDAGEMDPFLPGKLSFMISELPDAEHASDDPDHADNCPFCKHKLENAPKAIVEFRGANGEVLDGNARAELGVELGDVVYVTGSAEFNSAVNTVMINATGVYRATSP